MRESATQTERDAELASAPMAMRAPDQALVVADAGGRVRQISPPAERLLALGPGAGLGLSLAELLPGWPGASAAAGTLAVAGRELGYHATPLMLADPPALPAGTLVLLHDRTAELAGARQSYDYLCRALHDVRVPLQAIVGAAEGLLRGWFGPLTDDQREYAGIIKENSQFQAGLFSQIHDVYALAVGVIELDRAPLSMAGLLRELEHDLAGQFAARPLSLTIDLAEPLPALQADRQRLRQVLQILLSNALRYTFPGGAVRVSARAQGRELLVEVRDTGVGIRSDDQPRIFTPFFRGDNPLKEGRYGGLSLVIARQLAELHAGRLWFTSAEGQGSTFSLALPAADSER